MDDAKVAREKLRRIRQLWLELERLEEGTAEYEVLAKKIHALSIEFKTLMLKEEAAKKRERSGDGVQNRTEDSEN